MQTHTLIRIADFSSDSNAAKHGPSTMQVINMPVLDFIHISAVTTDGEKGQNVSELKLCLKNY